MVTNPKKATQVRRLAVAIRLKTWGIIADIVSKTIIAVAALGLTAGTAFISHLDQQTAQAEQQRANAETARANSEKAVADSGSSVRRARSGRDRG